MLISPIVVAILSSLDPYTSADRLRAQVSKPPLMQQQDPPAGADDSKKRPTVSWRYEKIFRLDLEATFQEDLHASYDGADIKAGLKPVELQRNRVGVRGAFFKHIEFEAAREVTEKDIEAGKRARSPWKDVNVNLTYFKRVQLQFGKFKVPFGLDALTGTTHGDFVYRSLGADHLAPGRDVGAMVHGRLFKRGLSYWTGVFRHDGENASTGKVRGGDRTFAARVSGTPFRRAKVAGLGRVEIGAALAVSRVSDEAFQPKGLRGRTVMTEDTFFHPVYVRGWRRRVEGDLAWAAGPASLRAEYTLVTDDRRGQGYADEDLPDARYRSWYVGGTYRLTGDTKHAVKAVGRYERLWFDSVGAQGEPMRNPRAETIFPNGERVLTLGASWTLNRFITLQLNVLRETVDDAERNPGPQGTGFWSRVLRFQFAL